MDEAGEMDGAGEVHGAAGRSRAGVLGRDRAV